MIFQRLRKPDSDESGLPEINVKISDHDPQVSSVSHKLQDEYIETEMIPTQIELEKVVDRSRFEPVEFRINEKDGLLAIRFTGQHDQEWIDEIKTSGRFYFDKTRIEFLLPWSVMTGDSLSDYFSVHYNSLIPFRICHRKFHRSQR